MRRLIFLLLPGLMMTSGLMAQIQPGFSPGYMTNSFEVFDANGKTFTNPATTDIAGSPFWQDEWSECSLLTKDGKQYDHVRFRLNLQSQELHFQSKTNQELAAPAGSVTTILLYDSVIRGGSGTLFQCGFPAVDNRKTTDFYEILCQGKASLLHSRVKTLSVHKDDMSGEVTKEYLLYEDDYLFIQGKMVRLKKDRSFMLVQLADKKDQVSAYINNNNLKLKTIEEIKTLINYYNTLP